jgi:hypothetical protein
MEMTRLRRTYFPSPSSSPSPVCQIERLVNPTIQIWAKPYKIDYIDNLYKSGKPYKPDKSEKPDKPDKGREPYKPDKSDNPYKPDKHARLDNSDKPDNHISHRLLTKLKSLTARQVQQF